MAWRDHREPSTTFLWPSIAPGGGFRYEMMLSERINMVSCQEIENAAGGRAPRVGDGWRDTPRRTSRALSADGAAAAWPWAQRIYMLHISPKEPEAELLAARR